jgi:hypothetical protein
LEPFEAPIGGKAAGGKSVNTVQAPRSRRGFQPIFARLIATNLYQRAKDSNTNVRDFPTPAAWPPLQLPLLSVTQPAPEHCFRWRNQERDRKSEKPRRHWRKKTRLSSCPGLHDWPPPLDLSKARQRRALSF